MKTNEQSYYMVIPSEVWDSEISAKAMILYGHISVLANKKKYCFANNQYFETVMKMSTSTVNRCLLELEEANLIYRELIYKENSREVEQRKIYLNVGLQPRRTPIIKNDNRSIVKNDNRSIVKNDRDNTKITNNTSINTHAPLSR